MSALGVKRKSRVATGLAQWHSPHHDWVGVQVRCAETSSTAVQGLTHQGKEPSSPSRFMARRSRRLFCPLVRANIRHRPIRELPRSQRFAQQKEQVLVARVVVKGLVEAFDLGARTFEHLGKIGIAEEKRSGDLGGLVVTA
jgi:hypothetical protein